MSVKRKTRLDVHEAITNQIITAIEANPGDPSLPWQRSGLPIVRPKNIASNKVYNGINILALWAQADNQGYSTGVWGTYRQWRDKGCQVKRGEKASLVIFYKEFDVDPDSFTDPATGQKLTDANDDGKRRVARASRVFNADQVEGYEPDPQPHTSPVERMEQAENFIRNTKADIRIGGERAYYQPSVDHIHMPDETRFMDTSGGTRSQNWYAVELHELVHWSGAKHRLDRQFGKRFGDDAYCIEELVAELGSAFLCADLGITPHVRDDHAQYLAHWLAILKSDNRAIFAAAAKANAAVTYLENLQPPFDPD